MMSDFDFRGTGVALISPFNTKGQLDLNGFTRVLDHVSPHVDYLVLLGTTGESVTLKQEEKEKLRKSLLIHNEKYNKPLVLGIGTNDTAKVVRSIKRGDLTGISGILSVAPYYNKPSQAGIVAHYKAISDASPLPVIAYNVPGRTGLNMTSDTTLKIAEFKNIKAIKEASGDMNQIMRIMKAKPVDFQVVSGDDALTLPMILMGGTGVISVIANAYPKEFSDMVRLALAGDQSEALKEHYKLLDFIELLFVEGSPSGIKAALEIMNICKSEIRLPLTKVSSETYNKLQHFIQNYIQM